MGKVLDVDWQALAAGSCILAAVGSRSRAVAAVGSRSQAVVEEQRSQGTPAAHVCGRRRAAALQAQHQVDLQLGS